MFTVLTARSDKKLNVCPLEVLHEKYLGPNSIENVKIGDPYQPKTEKP